MGGMKSGMWTAVDNQTIINNAVAQQRPRLRACVQTEGGHFEHLLLLNKQTELLRNLILKIILCKKY